MKIAFHQNDSTFSGEFIEKLTNRLPQHEYLEWKMGANAPALDLDIVLVLGELSREQMQAQPKLLLIQTVTAGYDGVDVDAASQLGIWVSYAPSQTTGNAISVAEFAVLLMLGASRHLNQAIESVHDHAIAPPQVTPTLFGKTVCIVGLGGIGRLLADRLGAFGMQILAVDDYPKDVPQHVTVFPTKQLKTEIGRADHVVLCARAGKDNENLIDSTMLSAMKQGAVLVNIARGSLIDEEALFAAIKRGQLSAAGLDVLKTEPANPKNPLLTLPAALITPHIAGLTALTLSGTVDYVAGVLQQFAAGELIDSMVSTPHHPRRTLIKALNTSAA